MTDLTYDDNESGAISAPVEDDATGVDQAQQPISDAGRPDNFSGSDWTRAPREPQQQLSGLSAPQGPMAGAGKRLISYLMGADAAHPQTIDQVGQQIDPAAKMTPADRNLLAIQHIRDSEGDNAAWQLMQANRVAYNAQTAFALTALNGTPQKPADMNAAINAANKAQGNVLDGSNVHFAPRGDLVTATVSMPGTSQQQHIVLSKAQFAQWLNVGGDGQWDKVMSQSAPAVLQRLAASGPSRGATSLSQMRPLSRPAPKPQQGGDAQDAQGSYDDMQRSAPPSAAVRTGRPPAMDVTEGDQPEIPGTHDARGHYIGPAQPDKTGYDPQMEARSKEMFPGASQNHDRLQWIAQQEEREAVRENAVKVRDVMGKHAEEVARIGAGSREKVADTNSNAKLKGWQYASDAKKAVAQINADQKAAQQGNVDARQRIESARKAIATKRMTAGSLTPEDEALEKQLTAQGRAAAQPQQPQQRQPQQAQPQRSSQDQQALTWARSNPTDPRAAKILQKLGVQ